MNLTAIKEAFANPITAQVFLVQNVKYIVLILLFIIIWDTVWKLISMWKASKRNSKIWFVVLAIVNSLGILPILYLIFARTKKEKPNYNPVPGEIQNIKEAVKNEETNQLPPLS